jgi:hypothetical protein
MRVLSKGTLIKYINSSPGIKMGSALILPKFMRLNRQIVKAKLAKETASHYYSCTYE